MRDNKISSYVNNVFKKFSKAKKVLSHQKEKKVNEVNLLLTELGSLLYLIKQFLKKDY
ncbi:MAG TPA: hypothetical protein PKI14_09255 [Fervidobacterium sp.]|nr:hypothetical protein [Fervidobacterium sp.]HUM43121.1 hypothetical protein [Fervidobacterium sp.]